MFCSPLALVFGVCAECADSQLAVMLIDVRTSALTFASVHLSCSVNRVGVYMPTLTLASGQYCPVCRRVCPCDVCLLSFYVIKIPTQSQSQ